MDALPGGVDWQREEIILQGDILDAEGKAMTEDLEVWYRDPVACVKELMGNPMFRDVLQYKPSREWLDEGGNQEVISEMSSVKWWELQVRLKLNNSLLPSDLAAMSVSLTCRGYYCAVDPLVRQNQVIQLPRQQKCLALVSNHWQYI